MTAQRRETGPEDVSDEFAFAARRTSEAVPADGLDAARGVGWGLLLAIAAFWAPMFALWRWLHR